MIRQVLDNPLFQKHVRSQLRPHQVLPRLVVLVAVSLCVIGGRFVNDKVSAEVALIVFLQMQGAILILLGTLRVAGAVGRATASGMMDFHRASPLPPGDIALGFLLGAPLREYVAFAVIAPFTLIAAADSIGVGRGIGAMSALLMSALVFHAFGMLAGTFARRGLATGGGVVAFVMFAHMMAPFAVSGLPLPGLLTAVPVCAALIGSAHGAALQQWLVDVPFFGVDLPLALQSVIYQVPTFVLLVLATTRRVRSPSALLCRPSAAPVVLAILAVLATGGIVDQSGLSVRAALSAGPPLCVLLALSWAVVLAATPDRRTFVMGLRRDWRPGTARPFRFEGAGSNRVVTLQLAAVAIAFGCIAAMRMGNEFRNAAIAAGVVGASVIGFGGALQWCALRFPRRVMPYFVLILFLWCALPFLLSILSPDSDAARAIMGASPFRAVFEPTASGITITMAVAAWFFVLTAQAERATTAAVRVG